MMMMMNGESDTLEDGSFSDEAVSQELEMAFSNLSSKEEVLHALERSLVLHCIPLSVTIVTSEQAKRDFRRERVLFNDVPFIPDKADIHRCHAFTLTLHRLVQRLLIIAKLQAQVDGIAETIMQRACRTSAGADSFFVVQKLLCAAIPGLVVTQRTYQHEPPIKIDVFLTPVQNSGNISQLFSIQVDNVSGSEVMSAVSFDDPVTPTVNSMHTTTVHDHKLNDALSEQPSVQLASSYSSDITIPDAEARSNTDVIGKSIFESPDCGSVNASRSKTSSSPSLIARTQIMNSFAIYDTAVIDDIAGLKGDPPAWLEVEAMVVDESNFSTQEHWRRLQLVVTDPRTGMVYYSYPGCQRKSRSSRSSLFLSDLVSRFSYSLTASSSSSSCISSSCSVNAVLDVAQQNAATSPPDYKAP